MTSASIENQPTSPSRIHLPTFAAWLMGSSPFLLLFGGFLAQVNADRDVDWAIFQTMLGTAIFWIGVTALMSGLVLVGVRSIAQQQLDLLRAERR